MMELEKLYNSLSLEDICGQLLCYDINLKDGDEAIEADLKKMKPGGIFVGALQKDDIKKYAAMANKYTKLPVIVANDIENGAGCLIKGETALPSAMAWGAADDAELLFEASKETGKICRELGIQWSFAPVVDICYNKENPVTNNRAVSDNVEQVIKMCKAYSLGLQYNQNMVAGAKHFPGDGVDDRNQHFCTTINSLSREEWDNSYGLVYTEMIKSGTASIMVGHIGLPCYQTDVDENYGAKPAIISKEIITDLLKDKLGFDGCVISDAMSMIGTASRAPLSRLAIEFLNAGGDMVLFPEKNDFDYILSAVSAGEITQERVKDAFFRIIKLKNKARLFENAQTTGEKVDTQKIKDLAVKLASKSIKFVRNLDNILPLKIENGSKILMLNIVCPNFNAKPTGGEFNTLKIELENRGYLVDSFTNLGHYKIKEIMNNYQAILINCKMSPQDYHGGSMRIGWNCIMTFWRAYVFQHPKVIFTSFGDPYKIYEFPYLHTYINAFSSCNETQIGFVKVLLGEERMVAKNPVELKGFFKREV